MTDLFQEVEEEVRQDRLKRIWQQFGGLIIGLAVIVLAGVGGWRLYQAWSADQARNHSVDFVHAQTLLHEGKAAEAAEAFAALRGKGPQIYRQLALMEAGAAKAGQGDLPGAIADFDAAAAAAKDPIVRDMARLRAAYVVAETQDLAAVQARLAPIIEAGGAISYPARELLGVKAWDAGQFDLARQTFQSLSDAFQTPDSVRQRAQLALSVLGPGAAASAPAPAGEKQKQAAPPAPRPVGGETK
ncbi:MAG: tetratricopeptide repeat protein [Hyphomonadaceae bacterium]|nr:tetratricopeptide repeat protein [Hyphomonadaceae bacterium]